MKKKIMAIGLTVAVLAIAIVGMTLAYFTDKEPAVNTFTIGNVRIGLTEQQRNADSNELEPFTQGKQLLPIVGSVQAAPKDENGLPIIDNYVDKLVTITNTGDNAAYIRAYFAIPSVLDDGADSFNAGHNILHFNFGNKVVNGQVITTYDHEWIWNNDDPEESWKYFETNIDGISYNVYYADYYRTLLPGEITERLIDGVYLDSSVDFDAEGHLLHQGEIVDLEGLELDNIQCPVFAIACQAAGFESAEEAFNAAFESAEAPFNSAFPIPTPAPTDEPVE